MTTKICRFDKKVLEDTKWFSCKLKSLVSKYVNELQPQYKKFIFYSLFPGGKRIRPLLMFATGEMLGVNRNKLLYPACSIELIHNYSLIHDDLPSMDNDDYRRGKLTVHKKFGEANAILTGDGLLSLAFEVISDWGNVSSKTCLKITNLLANYIGFNGLIKGQLMDLDSKIFTEKEISKNTERYLNELVVNKTAKLIQLCIVIPGLVKMVDKKKLHMLNTIGINIGILFQITDDLIDYVSGQDKTNLSYPKVYGVQSVSELIKTLKVETINILRQNFDDVKSDYLHFLIQKIADRTQ
ncbi:MAG: polyprenyl synthetase family protein [Endomicrobia bacterium]|nr:polyprenyl synthetase family protein [Endomicrobiia bacterium]